MVELNHLYQKDQKDRGKTASVARGTVEFNRLFQKDRDKTASVAMILSLNPMQRPLPCLLIQSSYVVDYKIPFVKVDSTNCRLVDCRPTLQWLPFHVFFLIQICIIVTRT